MSRIQKSLLAVFAVALLLASAANLPGCAKSQAQWRLEEDLPEAADFCGVWGSSSSDIFAVGSLGKIVHYDGSSWQSMSSGTGHLFRGVWGTSSSDVFAVGSVGTILHYDGNTWSSMSAGSVIADLFAVSGSS